MITKDRSRVVLVKTDGSVIGDKEKLAAHQDGDLHLAFSVMLYRYRQGKRQYLLQQRAIEKYHCAELWANSCCSHPQYQESLQEAGVQRLFDELGIKKPLPLINIGHFIYRAKLDSGLIEHELDHILIADGDSVELQPNPHEVMNYCWWQVDELLATLKSEPHKFTPWLSQVVDLTERYLD
ncbi:isopentenyl-diphosphate Delta-isomerase [Vibrio sp. SS-MA-C1-2]|uniref:isopentenyl-diphosphate Delta-isomerase n=1 Tax=Vibrio sp. SS-MA-C1-2 TaxID=2908646 RepID=UPI001F423AA3|nr:isopentenyl-diphosphate Delta-isomerase [Vibrio sp. SS-MA-C1-2]UJF19099.1 isopentenyl-diphosphate Delta-isomerase [Vibrio sp. SS-MA-C1-2]